MYLNLAIDKLNAEATVDELSLEGFDSLGDFLSRFSSALPKFFKSIFNERFHAIDTMPRKTDSLLKAMKRNKVEFHTIEETLVYRPEDLQMPMPDFCEFLQEEAQTTFTIIERLYRPMNVWFAHALTVEGFTDKLWSDKDLEFKDIEEARERLKGFFDQDKDKSLSSDRQTLKELYHNERFIEKTFDRLTVSASMGREFDLELLRHEEKKLAGYIDQFLTRESEGTYGKIPKTTRRKIVKVLKAIVAETDYLVSLNYLMRVTITAWNDSLPIISDVIEEQ